MFEMLAYCIVECAHECNEQECSPSATLSCIDKGACQLAGFQECEAFSLGTSVSGKSCVYCNEYVALSQAMRDLIPIREILKEFMAVVFEIQPSIAYHAQFKSFTDVAEGTVPYHAIDQSILYEDNHDCLKFARMMAQLSPCTKHIGIPYHWFRTKIVNLHIHINLLIPNTSLPISSLKVFALSNFRPLGCFLWVGDPDSFLVERESNESTMHEWCTYDY